MRERCDTMQDGRRLMASLLRVVLAALMIGPPACFTTPRAEAPRPSAPPRVQPPGSGADFWASRLDPRACMLPVGAGERQHDCTSPAAPTPEAELTQLLSSGPTNRRPTQERAEREHAALRDTLTVVRDLGRRGSRPSSGEPSRKRPCRADAGGERGVTYAVAPRTWDTHLQRVNTELTLKAEQRKRETFVTSLVKLISHLNATVVAAKKIEKRGKGRSGVYSAPRAPEPGQLTKSVRREREKFIRQLAVHRKHVALVPLPAASELVSSLQGMLSDPTVLSKLGLAEVCIDVRGTQPDVEARLRAKERWEQAHKPRIDPLDPFAPTRKWLDIDAARAMMPDFGNEDRPVGPVANLERKRDVDPAGEEEWQPGPWDEESDGGWSGGEEEGRTPWYCEHCKVSVNNDDAWLEHINGKAHLKTLGFSMRRKEETEDEILDVLEAQIVRRRKLCLRRARLKQERGNRYCSSDSDVGKLSDDDPNDLYLFPDKWDWDT